MGDVAKGPKIPWVRFWVHRQRPLAGHFLLKNGKGSANRFNCQICASSVHKKKHPKNHYHTAYRTCGTPEVLPWLCGMALAGGCALWAVGGLPLGSQRGQKIPHLRYVMPFRSDGCVGICRVSTSFCRGVCRGRAPLGPQGSRAEARSPNLGLRASLPLTDDP